MHVYFFLFSLMLLLTMFLLSVGLAKRVGARLLLASTSEVYGGKWLGLPLDSFHPVLGEDGIKTKSRILFLRRPSLLFYPGAQQQRAAHLTIVVCRLPPLR